MDALTAVVIDDEPPARERLALMLAEAGVEVVASLPDAYAALDWFGAGHHCDAAFVDIQMPQMNGIQLAARLARLPHPPAVVFTTAHEEHALAAFDVNAADYLLKPVRRDRLAITLGKLPVHAPAQTPAIAASPATPRHFSVAERGRVKLVPLEAALYLKAELKYVTLKTGDGEHLLDTPLTQLETELGECALRIHRNCLVMRHAIAGFERDRDGGWHVVLKGSGERLPVSRRQQHVVREFR